MAGTGTHTYQLERAQLAALAESPTWLWIPGITTIDATESSNVEYHDADGKKGYPVASAPEGSGSAEWSEDVFAINSIMVGGAVTESGTEATRIQRWERPSRVRGDKFVLSGWSPNINDGSDDAGMQITFPRVTASSIKRNMGQNTRGLWTAEFAYEGDDNDAMVIYEILATEPEITTETFAVRLDAPTP